MKKILFCAVLVTMLAGCTSPKYNYMPSVQNISEPPIGTTNTAYVGDSLLKQGVMSKYDGLKVTAPARVSWAYTVTTGYLKKVGDDEKMNTICHWVQRSRPMLIRRLWLICGKVLWQKKEQIRFVS